MHHFFTSHPKQQALLNQPHQAPWQKNFHVPTLTAQAAGQHSVQGVCLLIFCTHLNAWLLWMMLRMLNWVIMVHLQRNELRVCLNCSRKVPVPKSYFSSHTEPGGAWCWAGGGSRAGAGAGTAAQAGAGTAAQAWAAAWGRSQARALAECFQVWNIQRWWEF